MGRISLAGSLAVPGAPLGVVVAPSRAPDPLRDPLRRGIADSLHVAGWATLLVTLTADGEVDVEREQLAARVASAIARIGDHPRCRGLPLGVLADGDAVAAALVATAHDPHRVHAVVCCGGDPGAVPEVLTHVLLPVLLLAGADDPEAIVSARTALRWLPHHAGIALVDAVRDPLCDPEGAGAVARQALRWFEAHLATLPC